MIGGNNIFSLETHQRSLIWSTREKVSGVGTLGKFQTKLPNIAPLILLSVRQTLFLDVLQDVALRRLPHRLCLLPTLEGATHRRPQRLRPRGRHRPEDRRQRQGRI